MRKGLMGALLAIVVHLSWLGTSLGAEAGLVIIDVRTPEEFAQGHVKGAINMSLAAANFETEMSKLDRTKSYALYCTAGKRSARAMEQMQKLKFEKLQNLGGLGEAAKKLGLSCEGPKGCN